MLRWEADRVRDSVLLHRGAHPPQRGGDRMAIERLAVCWQLPLPHVDAGSVVMPCKNPVSSIAHYILRN